MIKNRYILLMLAIGTLGILFFASLIHTDAAVIAATEPYYYQWTTTGSTGIVDEDSTSAVIFDGPNVYVSNSAVSANIVIRYNIIAVENLLEGNSPRLKIRYMDNGSKAKVLAHIKEVNLKSGTISTKMTFDSNSYSQSAKYQTRTIYNCSKPWKFDFVNKSYYVEVTLKKTGVNGNPALTGMNIMTSYCP